MRRNLGRYGIVPLLAVVSLGAVGREVPLVEAVKAADTATLRALLQQRIDVNAPEIDGTTALHWAAYREDLENADLLIRAGANVKAANRYGVTPLSLAAENGNALIIERLLRAGADPNTALPGGETALMTAARTGKADAVKVLLSHGASVNAQESIRGQTVLMWAAVEGHAAAIQVLVEGGADIHARSRAPAPGEKMAAAASEIYRNYARKERVDSLTPLLFAVRAGRIAAAQALLEAGANVNDTLEDGTSALVMAIANAHYELAAVLLDKGADPNAAAQGWTALHQLVRLRTLNIADIPHPVPTGRLSTLDLAKKLLAHGADVNARVTKKMNDGYQNSFDRIDATPLVLAAKGVDHEMMRFLVASGADPLLTNKAGTNVLMLAAGVNVQKGIDPGTIEDALEAVKVALELGLDVNAVNASGDTALHGAATKGANAIVQFLVDKGARLDATNQRGCTAIQVVNGNYACGRSQTPIPQTVALLRQLMTERGLPVGYLDNNEEKFAVGAEGYTGGTRKEPPKK